MTTEIDLNYWLYKRSNWTGYEACYLFAGKNPPNKETARPFPDTGGDGDYTVKVCDSARLLMKDYKDGYIKPVRIQTKCHPDSETHGYSEYSTVTLIEWSIRKRISIPPPFIEWYKKQRDPLNLIADDKPPSETIPQESTKQKITVDGLIKQFGESPTLEDIAAHFFNINTKTEANRKYKESKLFRVFKPDGATQRTSYFVDLESFVGYFNKLPAK